MSTNAFYITAKGDPTQVLRVGQVAVPSTLGESQVRVRILAAPVNPSDLYGVLGVYPVPLAESTLADAAGAKVLIPGYEGVAEVVAVGSGVTTAKVGDWVIPYKGGFATWAAEAVVDAANVFVVHAAGDANKLSLEDASALYINLPTAYRMLKDYADLQPGDYVVQNAANSLVGKYVIQMAREFGLKTINIVRDRPEFDALAAELRALGATAVVRDGTNELAEYVKQHAPKGTQLALNAVGGGAAAKALLDTLGYRGTLVTYGYLSGNAEATVDLGLGLFKDVRIRGFWVAQWDRESTVDAKREMNNALVALVRAGKVRSPAVERLPVPASGSLADAEKAVLPKVAGGLAGFIGKKFLLEFKH
ncbi:hypothetical protein H9P43_001074 [Blastocladiella emersonii ATCC 22665]|nr:hypothetical protein H9P43_001074 [Blastocladiella emersonii ATCC 22665]